jgi:hypothetical protein
MRPCADGVDARAAHSASATNERGSPSEPRSADLHRDNLVRELLGHFADGLAQQLIERRLQ